MNCFLKLSELSWAFSEGHHPRKVWRNRGGRWRLLGGGWPDSYLDNRYTFHFLALFFALLLFFIMSYEIRSLSFISGGQWPSEEDCFVPYPWSRRDPFRWAWGRVRVSRHNFKHNQICQKHSCRLCSVISPDFFDIESIGFDGCLIKHRLLDCFGQATLKTGANPLVCSSPRRRLRVTWRPDMQFKDVQHERLQHVYTCICTCMVRNALSQYVVRTMYSS